MKALTIKQPWAWAIAAGHKTVENRTWSTAYRGPLAIHAGLRPDPTAVYSPVLRRAVREAHERGEVDSWADAIVGASLTVGVILAVAELVDVHLAADCCRPWGEQRDPDGWPQRVRHWVLTDVRPLAEPVPATGRLGLWDVELPAAIGGA